MTTAWDLLIVTMDSTAGGPVDGDDLSLALAGAELLDLLDSGAAVVEDDRIVPGPPTTVDDALLQQAAASLVRQETYETVERWLWRRGERLSSAYREALTTEGRTARPRRRWMPLRTGRPELVDSPARRHAAERWASGEPVLAVLGSAVGLPAPDDSADRVSGEPAAAVLAAVGHAVTELEAVRQRRSVEAAAFDNIWRAP